MPRFEISKGECPEVSDYMYLLDMGQVKQGGAKKDFEADIREIIKVSLMAKD